MASIHLEVELDAAPEIVWDAVRDFGSVHERLAPGFVVETKLEEGARLVTFANGTTARELLVDLDDHRRRLAYSVVSERVKHHNASFQVLENHGNGSRVVWTTDVLPEEIVPYIRSQMELGVNAMARQFSDLR